MSREVLRRDIGHVEHVFLGLDNLEGNVCYAVHRGTGEGNSGASASNSAQKTESSELRTWVVLIHGFGCSKETFTSTSQISTMRGLFPDANILVPDLVGHGVSCCPLDERVYSMRHQAAVVVAMCRHEFQLTRQNGYIRSSQLSGLKIVFVGWSMGGPIALHCCELVKSAIPNVKHVGIISAEGNIDSDDCFCTRKRLAHRPIVSMGPDSDISRTSAVEYANYFSALSLVQDSDSGEIIHGYKELRAKGVPTLFLIGERNTNKYPCQQKLENENFEVKFVSRAAHAMHTDNPVEFYACVRDFCTDNVFLPHLPANMLMPPSVFAPTPSPSAPVHFPVALCPAPPSPLAPASFVSPTMTGYSNQRAVASLPFQQYHQYMGANSSAHIPSRGYTHR